jgi:hypothetical protein
VITNSVTTQHPHDEDAASAPVVPLPTASTPPPGPFAVPGKWQPDATVPVLNIDFRLLMIFFRRESWRHYLLN